MATPVKTLLVVGAGAGLGYSVAERFGRKGFDVALISRSQDNVDTLVTRLAQLGIEAAGFAAALRNYANVLHAALRETGVYAGTLMIATLIQKNTPGDPDLLAEEFWRMYL
jgi:NADP-dependent 3-hydroxy acid dehydrogenase YdfG